MCLSISVFLYLLLATTSSIMSPLFNVSISISIFLTVFGLYHSSCVSLSASDAMCLSQSLSLFISFCLGL